MPWPAVIGARAESGVHPQVESSAGLLHPGSDDVGAGAAYRFAGKMRTLVRWLSRGLAGSVPVEALVLRCFGIAWLVLSVAGTFTTSPRPGLHGHGAVVLGGLIVLLVTALATQPHRLDASPGRRVAGLTAVTAASAVLAVAQPNGIWQAGPVFVGIISAVGLPRRTGVRMLAFSLTVLIAVVAIDGRSGSALSLLMQAVPWFLVMRLLRRFREQRDALDASRAAEARAAAAAERGRLAREMHDVLAHSLSALALQLESTRLLARSRSVDDDVAVALDRAHHLAVSGLEEARRAIAAERGDELPGPELIPALAGAFEEQSGLPVAVKISGEPHDLAPEARLAVYRTAQEALTNVRRHAAAERVEVRLDYGRERTVLIVEDRAAAGVPAPLPVSGSSASSGSGLSGGYGLTGMRERAELLGGQLLAAPTSRGFRVELRLPAQT